MPSGTYLGRSRRLIDGAEKVSGHVCYTADLALPGLTHGRPVLSPHAHARILAIDTDAARRMPGVVTVLTEADLPGRGQPVNSRPSAILARDRVVFAGQPVALVVAETEAAAEDAAAAVVVEYEPLPAVLDPLVALEPDAPPVHLDPLELGEEIANLHAAVGAETSEEGETAANVADKIHLRRGDVETGLREAEIVVRRRYRTPVVYQGYLEPHAAVAAYDPVRRRLHLHSSTQGQYLVRDLVARLVGLPPSQVRVTPMAVGGGFGSKYGVVDPLAAAAAMAVGRPVRVALSRTEDFLATTPAPATVIDLELGISAEKGVTAIRARVVVDQGAYPSPEGAIIAVLLSGYYRCANVDIEALDVLTHKQPAGAYRAPGAPPATFALEQAIDEAVRALGLDPLEFRLRHVASKAGPTGDGETAPSLGLRQCLERLRQHPLWRQRTRNPDEGLGLAIGAWPGAASPAAALCCVGGDGSVQVHVGSVDISGVNSSLVLVAAEVLQIDPDHIELVQDDTQSGLWAGPSGGSQTAYSVSVAVRAAAEEVRHQLLELAAERLEASVDDLELSGGAVSVRGVPGRAVSIGELARLAESSPEGGGPVTGRGRAAVAGLAPGAAAHLVRVRIDRETGVVDPIAYVAVQDVGFALNPLLIEGQVHGGTVQGLGWALHEALRTDSEGQVLTSSFGDYGIPTVDLTPDLEAVLVENPSEHGLMGARIVGEPPIVPGAAAVANAVADATGLRITELPLTPMVVWEALQGFKS
jgi:CO/xanthine dehydrogenase Mo-binding subunit